MPSRPSSLYVHIPFCDHLCAYCDFCKVFYRADWASSYLDALFSEISALPVKEFSTIYVGGGTPSSLSNEQFARLLRFLSPLHLPGGEFSLEANPESFDEEKAALCARYGVNRLSFGIQTSHPRLLALLGRKHDFAMAKEAIRRAKEAGISNVNADLMYALPGESEEEFEEDLRAFFDLDLPHYSCYSLILEEDTVFAKHGLRETDQDTQGACYERLLSYARKRGYRRYEVSNFAKPGMESKHNRVYWRDEEYYGVGLGASGYVNDTRYANVRSLPLYLREPGKRAEEELVGEEDARSYFLLCFLRLEEGFSREEYEKRFGASFEEEFPAARTLYSRGLLENADGRVRATDRGMMLLDSVLVDLFACRE